MSETSHAEPYRTRRTLYWHLTLTAILASTSFAGIVALSIIVPIGVQLDRAAVDSPEAIGLAEHLLFVHSAFWPVIALTLLASIAAGTVLYERMRSPLVRFVRSYERVAAGETPPTIRIRAADYLTEEAAALNRMLTALAAERAAHAAVVALVEEAQAELASHPGVPSSALENLQEASRLLTKPRAERVDVDAP